MSKWFCILSGVLFYLSANSQVDERIFLNNHLGFEYAANYPMQDQNILKPYDNLYSNIRVKIPSQLGSKFGLNYYFFINEFAGLYSGVKYISQKYYLAFIGDFYNFYENDFQLLKHNIIEIPFGFKYILPINDNYFDIGAGISYFHFMNSPETYKVELINVEKTDTFTLKTIPSNEIYPFLIDINIGYNIIQENNNLLRVALNYQRSFKKATLNTVEFNSYPDNELLYSSEIDLKGYLAISFSYTFSFVNRLENYIEKEIKEREKKLKGIIDM